MSDTARPEPIEEIVVVVPAHDEEELLGRCLSAISVAVQSLRAQRPGVLATTVVVLDRCRDGSERVAAAFDVEVVGADAGCVGVARAAGVRRAAALTGNDARRVWIASTDADTVVPENWLCQQVSAAEDGADLVVGRVEPDPLDLDHHVHAAWHRLHPPGAEHVHGANLGIRLDAYLECGGFPPLREHEDAALVAAAHRLGLRVARGTTALTSGRLHGRTGEGFAGYLLRLRNRLLPVESTGSA